jgi:hypothetical protein
MLAMLAQQGNWRLSGTVGSLSPAAPPREGKHLFEFHRKHSGQGHRFDLRFFRPFPAAIKKSSSFFPSLIAATSHRGFAPRPAQVSPDGPRYFGGTFLPRNALPPPRTILAPPTTAILSNCCSISARRLRRVSSTCSRRSMSASTVIPARSTFGIVISSPKNGIV